MYISSLRYVAKQFHHLGCEKVLAVYGFDNICCSLAQVFADRLGIDFERLAFTYDVRTNPKLTSEEKTAILIAFADHGMFKDLEFRPGIEDILRPVEFGADIKIDVNAYTPQIGNLKKDQLLAAVPGMKPEQVRIRPINTEATYAELLDTHSTFLIEDCPHRVASSDAIANLLPSYMPWSHDHQALQIMVGKNILHMDSLQDMVQFVYSTTQFIATGGI